MTVRPERPSTTGGSYFCPRTLKPIVEMWPAPDQATGVYRGCTEFQEMSLSTEWLTEEGRAAEVKRRLVERESSVGGPGRIPGDRQRNIQTIADLTFRNARLERAVARTAKAGLIASTVAFVCGFAFGAALVAAAL